MKRITVILSWKKYILLNSKEISKVTGLKGKISNVCTKKSQPLLCDCARGILLTCPSDYCGIGNEKNFDIVSVYSEAIVQAFYFQLVLYHSSLMVMISEFYTYP